jgi:hypothetical protein
MMLQAKLVAAGVTAAILASALSGCASNAQTGGVMGATAGCAFIAMMEKDPKKRAQACAAGAAVGAMTGYLIGRQKDLELAKTAAQNIQASQPGLVPVQMRTQSVAVPAESRNHFNNVATIDALDAMVVSVPVSQVQHMEPKAVTTLSLLGKYVAETPGNSKVVVSALSPKDYEFMVASMQKGYDKPQPAQKVAYQYRPLSRGTQATVEVTPVPV